MCVMFVRKYPNGLTDQYLNELTNMNFPIIYTMDVEPLDNNVAYQMIMKKYMSNERSINREREMKKRKWRLFYQYQLWAAKAAKRYGRDVRPDFLL